MIALDASLLIAALNGAEPGSDAALSVLQKSTPGTMVVHTVTLAEVLVGGVRLSQAVQMLAALRAAGIITAAHDEEEPLRLATLRVTSGLKLPDCCVLDVATQYHASIATFDLALARAAALSGIPVVP